MRYHVLKEMLEQYQGENSFRESGVAIAAMEVDYRAAQVTLRNARRLQRQAAAGERVPHVPKVDAGKTVKDRVSFFEQAASAAAVPSPSLTSNVEEAEKRVTVLRDQLLHKGARLTADGDVDWDWHTVHSQLDQFKYFFDARSQGMHQVEFASDGKLYVNTATARESVDTRDSTSLTDGEVKGLGIYVMDSRGQFYCAGHDDHTRHSSLLAARAVAGAGEWRVKEGRLEWISQKSGHYKPTLYNMLQVVHQLDKRQIRTYKLEVKYSPTASDVYQTPEAFLDDVGAHNRYDYEVMKLLMYSSHLGDDTLAPQNWYFKDDVRSDRGTRIVGVYSTKDHLPVKPKVVREWLKSRGYRPSQKDLDEYNKPLETLVTEKESKKSYLT